MSALYRRRISVRCWLRDILGLLLLLGGLAWAAAHGPLTLAWDAVTLDTTSQPTTILSYNLRWGTSSGQQSGGINVTSALACVASLCQMTVKGLNPNQSFFFVVTAVDDQGRESAISNEAIGRPSLVPHQ